MTDRIACFGELLLRLGAPHHQMLLQSPTLDVHIGGAEANVAVSLARLGHPTSMISVVPDNPLGAAAIGELRRHGVDTTAVMPAANGRMGLYFITTGAIHRPSDVIYDRAHSSFALAAPTLFDWDSLLGETKHFHVSGVTPAIGADTADAAIRAVRVARSRGLSVSFDGNFRAKLWAAWNGDAASITRTLMSEADLVFADHRDIAIALGWTPPDASPEVAIKSAAEAAFAAFPQLSRLATTIRSQRNVDHHALSAIMLTRDGAEHRTPTYELVPIVDRIGGGDAFAAGVLHGLHSGMGDPASLHFGLAAACLKHSIPGDFNLAGADDMTAFIEQGKFDVRR
jgi:2-dehydro-3-deoxygluconokinase